MGIDAGINNFEKEIIQASHKQPVLVDFWASWCAPCRILGPVLEELEKEYAGKFKLAKIDTESERELAMKFNISSIPAVKLFVDGKLADEFVGALPKNQIQAFLNKHIADENIIHLEELFKKGKFKKVCQYAVEKNLSGVKVEEIIWNCVIELLAEDEKDHENQLLSYLQIIPDIGGRFSDAKKLLIEILESKENPDILLNFKKLKNDELKTQTLDLFLELLKNSQTKEKGKKLLLLSFSILGESDPSVSEYRRKMSGLLFV